MIAERFVKREVLPGQESRVKNQKSGSSVLQVLYSRAIECRSRDSLCDTDSHIFPFDDNLQGLHSSGKLVVFQK